jgi:ABC-type glycerol-3-phosphate transport system permease component
MAVNTISKKRKQELGRQASIHIMLCIISLFFIVPFIWMFLSSFKPALEIISMPPTFLPEKFTFGNYKTIFERLHFWRYFLNSIVVSVAVTVTAMFTSSLAGFVFTKFDFPGKELIFIIFLAGLMIPFAVIVLPMYLFVSKIGLQNSYLGLILPLCVSPFGIFLVRQFMEGIPKEMVEAARIDGASNMWIYFRIMVPLSSAGIGGVGVFTFLWTWNQLWWPLMIISKSDMRTLPLAIAALTFQHAKRYDMIVTGATLAVIPVMIVFAFAQRQLIKGVTLTGMKV